MPVFVRASFNHCCIGTPFVLRSFPLGRSATQAHGRVVEHWKVPLLPATLNPLSSRDASKPGDGEGATDDERMRRAEELSRRTTDLEKSLMKLFQPCMKLLKLESLFLQLVNICNQQKIILK